MGKVRTRFAPSPTGFLHIGSLRIAIFCYLLAKSQGGDLILRIEDTDQKRRVKGAVENLLKILDWVGIKFDEGPKIGGEYGPYVQTERLKIYQGQIKKLISKGEAYYCFCSEERLKNLREKQIKEKKAPKYDNYCRNLSIADVNKKIKSKEKFVIRQKMPLDGITKVYDKLRGKIEFKNKDLEDQVLIKSNGVPTYQFASVVDDHLMEISHIVRGEEWIPSFPKNILLYNAFGWQLPKFIHIPLTLSKDGGKLSKRRGDVAVEDYKKKGYLPEALVNFSALLGWHPKNNREIFTLEELKNEFSFAGMGVSSAIFDLEKLRWINSEHIRRKTLTEFHKLAAPYYKGISEKLDLMEISKILHKRVDVLGAIPGMIGFFEKLPDYNLELFENEKMKTDKKIANEVLQKSISVFENIKEWNEEDIKEKLFNFIEKKKLKKGQALWPIRIALSGQRFTPGGAIEIANILGKEEVLKRIKAGVEKLE